MATYIGNVSADDVRALTDLPSGSISDDEILALQPYAASELNSDIQIIYKDWRVHTIDSWRNNDQDGSNTVFYVPDDKRPIGDYDSDGGIDTSDVVAYTIEPASGTGTSSSKRTSITVSAITDDELGKITLATAPPSNGSLYLTWAYTPLEMETPHPLIKKAIAQMTAALAYSRVDVGKVSKFRVGKVAVMQQSEAFKKYMDDYKQTVYKIKTDAVKMVEYELI